jgi:hypothetical protein
VCPAGLQPAVSLSEVQLRCAHRPGGLCSDGVQNREFNLTGNACHRCAKAMRGRIAFTPITECSLSWSNALSCGQIVSGRARGSRADDCVLAIANFSERRSGEECCGEAAATDTRAACAPQSVRINAGPRSAPPATTKRGRRLRLARLRKRVWNDRFVLASWPNRKH